MSTHIEKITKERLACPISHENLTVENGFISCQKSSFKGFIEGEVVVTIRLKSTYFDDKYEVIQSSSLRPAEQFFAYRQQAEFLEKEIKTCLTLLDVGCGPTLLYNPPS